MTLDSETAPTTLAQPAGLTVARNARWNLIGQVIPPALALVALPLLTDRIGPAQLGLLSHSLAVLGVAVNLGFARAATRFVAEAIAEADPARAAAVVWNTAAVQAVLGITGGLLLAGIAGWLATLPDFEPVAALVRPVFLLTALGMPFALVMGAFRGALEGSQHFGLSNSVMAPLGAGSWLLPLFAVWAGWSLVEGVLLLVVGRVIALLVMAAMVRRTMPELFRPSARSGDLRALLHFGGWATVSTTVTPLFQYLDRWLITFLIGVGAVGYYSPAFELATKMQLIPLSIGAALFPALAALIGSGQHEDAGRLASRSSHYIGLGLAPLVLFMAIAADPFMRLWIGADFAAAGSGALQILAIGVLVNSLAHVPFSVLQGVGRSDLTARLHLIELPLYAALAWFLVGRWGLVGAAAAWSARVAVDTGLLMIMVRKVAPEASPRIEGSSTRKLWAFLAVFTGAAVAADRVLPSDLSRVAAVGLIAAGLAVALWAYVLSAEERLGLWALLRPRGRS